MKLPLLVLGVATCLAASLMLAVPTSARPSGVSIVHGTLRDTDGSAFPAGSAVSLWASTPATDLEVGDSVVSSVVASTTTDANGGFDLGVPDVASVSGLASRDQLVDFEVRAADGTAFAPYAFSRSVVDSGPSATLVEPGAEGLPASAARRAADDAVEITALEGDVDPLVSRSAVRSGAARTQVCGETRVTNLGSRQVRVGSTSASAGITAQFTYANGASSTIGAGFSTSGKAGSWSQSGTTTTKATTTIAFGKRTGSHVYLTTFRFGKYSQWCYSLGSGPAGKKVYAYKVRADRYLGGSIMLTGKAPAATKCRPFSSGATHNQTSTTAYTWTTGASTSPVIGISLSSRAGYSTTAKVSITNNNKTPKQLCGTHDFVTGNPKRIVGK